jgi:undecaprenyl-diphosphatase
MSLVIVGSLLFLLGLSYRFASVAQLDARVFWGLHSRLRQSVLPQFFRLIWPLGTSPVAILVMIVIWIVDLRLGAVTTGIYAVIGALEWFIKTQFKRPRPFKFLHNVEMLQPRSPKDPSFPSGDAMHVWYVSLILPTILGLSTTYAIICILLASLVTLGRIALGVHFPLDTLAGAGLGILAAGIWKILI